MPTLLLGRLASSKGKNSKIELPINTVILLVQVWTADHSEGSIQAKPEQWERIFHMPSIKEGTAMRFLPVELVQQFPCAVIPLPERKE